MASILLIDDDSEAVLSLSRALKASGIEAAIHAATGKVQALKITTSEHPAVVVLDLSLNPAEGVESGYSLLSEILAIDSTIRIIVLTGHGGTEFGIRSLELGASHFLQKPADILHLRALIRDGLAQNDLRRDFRALQRKEISVQSSPIIGKSPAAQKLREDISYAAFTPQPVFLQGETGTGKGLCAFEIHTLSNRSSKNFIRYQTSFGTADLVASDLFGHAKGAFTGATDSRRGLICEADGGSLFLDEIDQLPLETQVTLLGTLQDKQIRPVGGNRAVLSDFRLITASNGDIKKAIEKGTFRQDFFHRIAHLTISIPPLRDRKDDIALLVNHILSLFRARSDISVFSLSESALTKLYSYNWPGNIRELEAVIEGSAYRAQYNHRSIIESEDISIGKTGEQKNASVSFHAQVEEFKLALINQALATFGNNQVKAAESLLIDRTSMRRIMERSKGGK